MSAYSDLVALHGAVHYWRLDETAGTSAIDSIGGSTGTLTGAVALNQPGAITDGTAGMGFTGDPFQAAIGGRISTGVFTAIPQPLTLELWVKTSVPEERAMASTRDSPNPGQIFVGMLTGALRTYYDPTGAYSGGVRSISDGQWHHVVWVFVGGSPIAAYVDGTVETLTPATTVNALFTWNRLTIGFEPLGGAKAWTGSIDEVAIYPRALTPAEITQHYTVGTTVQASVPSAGCDHTTVWSQHLATLNAPKVESERAYLSALYVQPPGQDMSYLVSRYLQAITCGAVATTPSAPTLSVVTPNTGTQGTVVTVDITGTGFVTDATTVEVTGTGVVVGNVHVLSGGTLRADIAIDALATAGARALTVRNAGGSSSSQSFTVQTVPITLIASRSTGSATTSTLGGTSAPIDTTGATCLVVSASWVSSTITLTDSYGNVWVPLTGYNTSSQWQKLWYCLNPIVGAAHTFTCTSPGASNPGWHVYAFANVHSFQITRGATGISTTSLATTSVTPSVHGALIVTGLGATTAATNTVTPGFLPVDQITFAAGTQNQACAAWQIQATAAPINPTWGASVAQQFVCVSCAVFLP